ncbi:MAG: hypothetical protein P8R54_12085 [Myxococcota bacterium]|nr:hypothetical protein [Myxococcota bacterium]
MRLLPILLSSLMVSCVKHPAPASLSGSKWMGSFDINSECDNGGYTGTPLRACIVLSTAGGGVMTADVDWDAANLRDECDYFTFHGAFDAATLTLVRNDEEEESDDTLRLKFAGDTIVGTFQAHPSCDEWPVKLERIR